MPAVSDKMSVEMFEATFAQEKPYFELINGEPLQKAMGTDLHSTLQVLLSLLVRELGFKARTELTLAIDQEWRPIPDISGLIAAEQSPYPTTPVAVAIEILSPDDRFSVVQRKCRRYSSWGVQDILVFDPVDRLAWFWDSQMKELRSIQSHYRFASRPVEIALASVWERLDQELA